MSSAEPFEGKSGLDLDVRLSLGQYLRDIGDRLGLRDWDIRVSEGVPESKTSIAATFIRENAREAVVAFADDFFARPETYRRTTLVHEVLHLHLHPLVTYAVDAVEGEVGPAFERLFARTIRNYEETSVDALAWGVARWMPPSPDGRTIPVALEPHAHHEAEGSVHA